MEKLNKSEFNEYKEGLHIYSLVIDAKELSESILISVKDEFNDVKELYSIINSLLAYSDREFLNTAIDVIDRHPEQYKEQKKWILSSFKSSIGYISEEDKTSSMLEDIINKLNSFKADRKDVK